MTIWNDLIPFTDGEGYIAPYPVKPTDIRSSDNQTMFTSEAAILIHRNLDPGFDFDPLQWEQKIRATMQVPGLTSRSPGDKAMDAPDNMYAILSASQILGHTQVALDILNYGKANYGFYNNQNPNHIKDTDGKLDWANFQWRQLPLVFAMYTASQTYKWYKPWLWPLNALTAIVIATSCMNVPTGETDARRLSWHLIQATTNSLLCRLAAKIWYNRLYKDYGARGMMAVSDIYYQPHGEHPFSKYKWE